MTTIVLWIDNTTHLIIKISRRLPLALPKRNMVYFLRIATGFALVLAVLGLSQVNPALWIVGVICLQLIAYHEFRRACRVTIPRHDAMVLWMIGSYTHLFTGCKLAYLLLGIVPMVELRAVTSTENKLPGHYQEIFTNCCIILVTSAGHLHVLNLRKDVGWFLLPIICCTTNDIAAFVIGKLWGNKKLCSLSPNKTVEGFMGAGLVTMFVAGITTLPLFVRCMYTCHEDEEWLRIAVNDHHLELSKIVVYHLTIGVLSSTIIPLSILLLSGLKRGVNIKDFGTCLPGHGGVVDRVDCIALGGFCMWCLL